MTTLFIEEGDVEFLELTPEELIQYQYNLIWKQLNDSRRNRQMVMCWGANTKVGGADENGCAFLQFNVNGLRFKGKVRVTLTPDNVYRVDYIKCSRKQGVLTCKVVHTQEDVYNDNLTEVIDFYVESKID